MSSFADDARDDRRLLRQYAEEGAQDAFRKLVDRYSGLVYGTAMRITRNREWAADATQNVFTALAGKSSHLVRTEIASVGAWLHRAATFESKRQVRDQANAQRRQAMIRKNLTDLTREFDHSHWDEVRPSLDEALEKLPERDREILLLRYFDGLKYREIAGRLGMRSDAAQKRGARALDRLSHLLRKKGGILSASALAAGLAPELAHSAPPSLVTQIIASNAVKGGGSGLAAGGAMTTISIMFMNKAAILGIIIVALVGSIGIGFLIGGSWSGGEEAPGDALKTLPPPGSPSVNQDQGREEELAEPESAQTASEQFVARLKSLMEKKRALLRAAEERHQNGTASPEVVSEDLAKIGGVFKSMELASGKLAHSDMMAALAGVKNLGDGEAKILGLQSLLSRWAALNPEEALWRGAGWKSGAETFVYYGWGRSDPEGALGHFRRKFSDRDAGWRLAALQAIYAGWLTVDPEAARKGIDNLVIDDLDQFLAYTEMLMIELEATRPAICEGIARLRVKFGFAKTLERVRAINNEAIRNQAMLILAFGISELQNQRQAVDALLGALPDAERSDMIPIVLVAWALTGEFEEISEWIRANEGILNGSSASEIELAVSIGLSHSSPERAARWLNMGSPDYFRVEKIKAITARWARDDSRAVARWLETLPPGRMADGAVSAYAEELVDGHPSAAAEWASRIEDQRLRRERLGQILSRWRRQDMKAASEFERNLNSQ